MIEYDFFPTLPHESKVLLDHLPMGKNVTILEPCAGRGDLVRAIRERGHRVITNELDPRWRAEYRLDITDPASWEKLPQVNWIIMNPPFNRIDRIVPQALLHASRGLACFARYSWLEVTKGRRDWFAACAPWIRLLIFMPKVPYFTDHPVDMVGRIWIVWDKLHDPDRGIEIVWDDWRSSRWFDPGYDYQRYGEVNHERRSADGDAQRTRRDKAGEEKAGRTVGEPALA